MSDDLVKRLRDLGDHASFEPHMHHTAADRIEQLEAKLAEAVEALTFYATLIGEKHECPWHMLSDDYGEKARTTLAELKGGQ